MHIKAKTTDGQEVHIFHLGTAKTLGRLIERDRQMAERNPESRERFEVSVTYPDTGQNTIIPGAEIDPDSIEDVGEAD